MKISLILSILIHTFVYFVIGGFFTPNFKNVNKNLEINSTQVSVLSLPSYNAIISKKPIIQNLNLEISNLNTRNVQKLDFELPYVTPSIGGMNVHDKNNLKFFQHNIKNNKELFDFKKPVQIKTNNGIKKDFIFDNKFIENLFLELEIDIKGYDLAEELTSDLENKKPSFSSYLNLEDNKNIFENLSKIETELTSLKKIITSKQRKTIKNNEKIFQNNSLYTSKVKQSKLEKSDLKIWSSKILQEINSNINYPIIALQNQISGRVTIQLSITNKGILKKLFLLQSSGFDILDNEVLRAVRNAGDYPTAPLSLTRKQYSFKLPIKFEI
jgi:TonB family protein